MNKHTKQIALLVLAIGLGYWMLGSARTSLRAEPVFQIDFAQKNSPVYGLSRNPIPNRGYLHASIATDTASHFYSLALKRDAEQEKRMAHPRHANIISVLALDVKGNAEQAVPLKREDGRYVRYLCEFFSVSPSGKRWWTARRPYESPSDLQQGSNPKGVVTAYSNDGKVLQEWTLPTSIGSVMLVGAVGEAQVCVVGQESVGQKGKLWVYRIGQTLPQELPYPSNWLPMISASLITSEGEFWCLVPDMSGVVEARVAQLTQSARVFTTFKWHRKGSSPGLFWQDAQAGLFVFENLKDEKGKIRLREGAKAVYRVAPDGTVHKLFETPDVLQTRRGEEVRAGQLLKADANFVWMEATYLKDGKVSEYQIVKVPIS